MTVCIAAVAKQSKIILIADTGLSTDYFAADGIAMKGYSIHPDWKVLISGNDLTRISSILERARQYTGPSDEHITYLHARNVMRNAFQSEIVSKAEDIFLSRYQMTMATFLKEGPKTFGRQIFSDMKYQIDNVRLGCSFLVAGFDNEKEPHIFSIEDPAGEPEDHDLYGFWAIGSGSHAALSTLFFHCFSTRLPIEKAIYVVCSAKFIAESDPRIGKMTFGLLLEPNRDGILLAPITDIRELWNQKGAPRIPAEANEVVSSMLSKATKMKSFK